MAVRSREEILATFGEMMGERNDDEVINFLEDINDTWSDMDTRILSSGEDWKAKYEESESTWRARYKERFLNNTPIENEKEIMAEETVSESPKTFEDLFKEEVL